MPICQHCHKQWSWKQVMKRSFTLNHFLICPHCGEKQYVTKRSRRRSAAMNFIPPLFILFPLLFNVSVWIGLGLIVASGVLLYSFYPFIIELSNEEEALW
ncbi:hypothetical protein GW534_02865 [Bacillus sp. P1(2020)]|uniref:CXXC-20-CXXC protein n=2 Tax=Pallidibacillus pasinlerensis TaxID=2703818 RepID=A0ABW9ZZW8_9BACI|nr:TIGR04104 family putative zinc finger protein [Pallidibacillus pasinlerensis]NCU16715.1 hypothetical protein [Pallidibacillus pasinlerensis]